MSDSWQTGGFYVDPSSNQITDRHKGQTLKLQPQTMDLLVLFINNYDTTLSKEDIIEHIWPDTIVSESSLARVIADLRKALNDNARDPKYIKTLSKKGYRLISEPKLLYKSNIAENKLVENKGVEKKAVEKKSVENQKEENQSDESQKEENQQSENPNSDNNRSSSTFYLIILPILFLLTGWYLLAGKEKAIQWQNAPESDAITFDNNYNRSPVFSNSEEFALFVVSNTSFNNDQIMVGDGQLKQFSALPIKENLQYGKATFALDDSHIAIRGLFDNRCEIRLYDILSATVIRKFDCFSAVENNIHWSAPYNALLTIEFNETLSGIKQWYVRVIPLDQESELQTANIDLPVTAQITNTAIAHNGVQLAFSYNDRNIAKEGIGYIDLESQKQTWFSNNFLAITDVNWSWDDQSLLYSVHGTSLTGIWKKSLIDQETTHLYRGDVWQFATSHNDSQLLITEWEVFSDLASVFVDSELNATDYKTWPTEGENEIFPTYSNDGKHLAYVSTKSGFLGVWLRDTQSRQSRLLKKNLDGNTLDIQWQTDNNSLLLLQEKISGERYIERIDLEGHAEILTSVHPTTRAFALEEESSILYWSFWEPKGSGQIVASDLTQNTQAIISHHFVTAMKLQSGNLYVSGKINNEHGLYVSRGGHSFQSFQRLPNINPPDANAWYINEEAIWSIEKIPENGLAFSLNKLQLDNGDFTSSRVFDYTTQVPSYTIQPFLGMTGFENEFIFPSINYTKSNLKLLRFNDR